MVMSTRLPPFFRKSRAFIKSNQLKVKKKKKEKERKEKKKKKRKEIFQLKFSINHIFANKVFIFSLLRQFVFSQSHGRTVLSTKYGSPRKRQSVIYHQDLLFSAEDLVSVEFQTL